MKEVITIKDIPKKKFIYLSTDKFSRIKTMDMVNELLVWLIGKGISVTDLPVVIKKADKIQVGTVIKDTHIQETKKYKIGHLGAHRMGSIFCHESNKPLNIFEDYLEKQLQYDGYQLLEPRRYVLHPNQQEPKTPIIEIQIPICK